MEEKITIIEGPPPTFETVNENWALSLNETPVLSDIAVTRLRTFNGPALVERCHRAWRNQQPIHLEFRTMDGLEQRAPIVAARFVDTDEGQMLLLWVRIVNDDAELELDYEDDEEDDDFDDYDDPDDLDGNDPLGPADWSL